MQPVSAPPLQTLPKPLSQGQMQGIQCIATFGLLARDQRSGEAYARRYPDFTQRGRQYAGIVGDRIVFESNQPKEVIALAIRRSAEDQQKRATQVESPDILFDVLVSECQPLLDAEVPLAEIETPETIAP